jgi:hypothetical protein
MVSKTALAAVAALVVTTPLSASTPPGPLVQISGASPFIDCTADFPELQPGTVYVGSEVEPFVAVNPTDPDNLVATWQQDRWSSGAARGAAVGVSFDGGLSWQNVVLPGLTLCSGGPAIRSSDPWVSFGPDGTVYHMSLLTALGPNAMTVQKSTDGGLTWSGPVPLIIDDPPFFNDKNTLTADPTDPDLVYATWDRLDFVSDTGPAVLARSTDGGETFEPVTVIYDPGPGAQTIGNQIVVQPDGTVIDFFSDVAFDPSIPGLVLTISLKRSPDKGLTWLPAGPPIPVSVIGSNFAVAEPDNGIPVRDANILFDVAVDPTDGTLYAVWQDARFNGFQYDAVAFSRSTDGGWTWSAPIQVNQTPGDVPVANRQAFVPSVEVNRKGRVAVTWYDFRFNGAEPESLADHWAVTCNAFKLDCSDPGAWSGELRLTDESFDLLRAPFAGGLFLGDYVGLAAAVNDFVAVFTITEDDDRANIYVRRFDEGPEREEPEGAALGLRAEAERLAAPGAPGAPVPTLLLQKN